MNKKEDVLINRVANSGLITLNLEDHYPKNDMVTFDIKDYLFHELILKEKDFRMALKELDWQQYQNKILLVLCSTDAIIPVWAYMLITGYAEGIAADIFAGSKEEYLKAHYYKVIKDMDLSEYKEKRIVIKGCSNRPVPAAAYLQLTQGLKPHAQSIMYGEPCSTVPIFKRPRSLKK
ncbi:MAG: DUF2480 family protein [Saprospiraceae bacterium]|nr:DUF2480 family protein [Saprospiraceae bacterium]